MKEDSSAERKELWRMSLQCKMQRTVIDEGEREQWEKGGIYVQSFLLFQAAYSVAEITSRWGELPDRYKNTTFYTFLVLAAYASP